MAENKYSLDNILSEYPSDHSTGGGSSESLDEILNSYPATKTFEDSGLAEIFDSRRSTTDIDLSGINISLSKDYPSPEEIRRRDAAAKAEQIAREDAIKRRKQVDYEIMSGDYERKYMPDELKTSDELEAERQAGQQQNTPAQDTHDHVVPKSKKVKVKPAKKKYGLDFADDIKGLRSHDDDDFDSKYGSAPLFTEEDGELLLGFDNEPPFEPTPESGSSLSEKMERSNEYEEKYRSTAPTAQAAKVKPEKASVKPAPKADPFDKYIADDSIDDILKQYDRKKAKPAGTVKSETSPLKGFTDIFNKLMAKEEAASGGSELLENAKRIKPTSPAPIERKHISDIELDLSDKMIQDTAQISRDTASAELEKINKLKERRSDKVKNFVLLGDEEETDEADLDPADEAEEIEDFEKLEDVQAITDHIEEQKNKLFARFFVLLACFAVTVYMAVANDFELPVLQSFTLINKRIQPDVFLFINSLIGVAAGLASYQTVSCGISKLLSRRADTDSLSAVALISSLMTSMLSITVPNMVRGSFVYVYVPVAIGALIFNTIGKLYIMSRTQRSFNAISSDNDHYALFVMEDEDKAQNFTRGSMADYPVLAGMQKTELITDFLKTSYTGDSTDRFCRIAAPVITVSGLIIGLISGFMSVSAHGSLGAVCMGLSTFSACAALCSCFSMMLIVNVPMNKASRKYNEKQGAIIGFDSIDEFSDTNSILIDAAHLFPPGSIKLINIKSFPDTSINEAIVEAASLTSQSGSILKSMFYDIIVGKTEMLDPVESYLYEDSMGLCGWINNKRVLLGNRELMQNHSIEGLPSIAKEREYTDEHKIAVYLSISGQLSSMFIIELTPSYRIRQSLKELEKANIAVIIRSVDSMLSITRLAELFDVSPAMFKLIPFRLHPEFEKATEYTAKRSATLCCSGRFPSFAQLILGANRLRGTISAGIAMEAAAIILGIILTLVLVLLKSMAELTVTNVLLYNFVFAALYCLFQTFRKV